MTTEDIIIQIFCRVDDQMPDIKKHPQAKLYPSELVTIGILFSL
ncbi:MAG: transposase, partial [Anaerolineae bacterium]|nr:transposase [Anaerolineae bacterium]